MTDKRAYREVIGERFKQLREQRGLSLYKVAQKGSIQIGQAKAVEEGVTNYTMDIFIGYIIGSDLYMSFAEKENENDLNDLVDKSAKDD